MARVTGVRAACWLCALPGVLTSALGPTPWYAGIEGVQVFAPGDDVAGAVGSIFAEMQLAEFSPKRYAVLLRAGDYGALQIPVGYYTSVLGVGAARADVRVQSFYSDDGLGGEATRNFWRSVEGLTATGTDGVMWATSQAAPVRRVDVAGDVRLSDKGYSSGGFLGDVSIGGGLDSGSQQQFAFRNIRVAGQTTLNGFNFVFVGAQGAPQPVLGHPALSVVDATPVVAEKPYLVELSGQWWIAVPPVRQQSTGPSDDGSVTARIPIEDVFVARQGDSAAAINGGIAGKQALLLTPSLYSLEAPIRIADPNFVVLGIGFPTLIAASGLSAMVVSAPGARLAGVLLEAGAALGGAATQPLLLWTGPAGLLSDVFSRAGAFQYATPTRASCVLTRADVHVQLEGAGTVVDNTWFWHADHDDCGGKSDSCYSGRGLVVRAPQVIIYALQVEHTMANLVEWYGEDGQVFLFQSELPYHDPSFGSQGFVGYSVDYGVVSHRAVGVGVYIVGGMVMPTAIRVPHTAAMQNMLAWAITGSTAQFQSVVCVGPEQVRCFQADSCSGRACYLSALPASGSGLCFVGEAVACPGSGTSCSGRQCCPDGSICPSAPRDFEQCPKAKALDCTAPTQREGDVIVI